MRVLLDTHAFLWWIANERGLSAAARAVMGEGENELLLSAASAWEIAIKVQNGRLTLPEPPARFVPEQMAANGIRALAVLVSHALLVGQLPPLHRDPFDRLLIAQAQSEKLPILTADDQIRQYAVETIW